MLVQVPDPPWNEDAVAKWLAGLAPGVRELITTNDELLLRILINATAQDMIEKARATLLYIGALTDEDITVLRSILHDVSMGNFVTDPDVQNSAGQICSKLPIP